MWQASLPVNFCNFWMGKWKCLSEVSWLFATPWTVAHQVPLVWGILQARILEWLAIPFSRGSSRPRDQTWVSCIAGKFFTWMRKASENKTLLNDTVFAARNFLYRNTCKMSNRKKKNKKKNRKKKTQTGFFVLSVHMHNQSSSGAHYFDLELACTYVARFCFSFLFACVAIFANLKVYLLKC